MKRSAKRGPARRPMLLPWFPRWSVSPTSIMPLWPLWGGYMAMKGLTDVGSLASYLVFVRQAAMPINQFTQQSNFLLAALAGAEQVFEAMDQPPETDEGQVRLVKEREGDWAWQKPDGTRVPLRGDVRFDHVTFGYDDGHPILQDISLFAKPGQKIAFVGAHRCGERPPLPI